MMENRAIETEFINDQQRVEEEEATAIEVDLRPGVAAAPLAQTQQGDPEVQERSQRS